MAHDGAQAQLHVVELDGAAELQLESLKDAAFRRIQKGVMTIKKLVDDFAAVRLLAHNGLTEVSIRRAPGVRPAQSQVVIRVSGAGW